MSCSNWCLDISAYIDGCLEHSRLSAVRKHLEECSECSSFYEEQRRLNELLESRLLDREPPVGIWHRIEAQLTPAPSTRKPWRVLELFRIPQVGYAAGALAVLLVGALVLFEGPSIDDQDARYLAEIDAFTIEIEGNPFFRDVQAENPFLRLGQLEMGNPFEGLGGSKQ